MTKSTPSAEADLRHLDWAAHLDWMEGLEPVRMVPKKSPRTPGVIVAAVVTGIAMWLGEAHFWPFQLSSGMHPFDAALLAMLLGMLVGNLWPQFGFLQPGMRYGAKTLLAWGIVLLGVRLNFVQLLQVGGYGLALSAASVVFALIATCYLVAPFFGISKRFGFLLATGTAICGGSAIVAMAPVVKAKEEEVVLGVASVTLAGLIAMLLLPIIGHAVHMKAQAYGVWAGLSIHQVPQVIAAGFSYGPISGEFATLIKLARVCLLAPVVLCASIWMARSSGGAEKKKGGLLQIFIKGIPPFVIGFVIMAGIQSLGLFPKIQMAWPAIMGLGARNVGISISDICAWGATFLLALGMAGVGWETRFSSLARAGAKPLGVTLLVSLLLAFVAFWSSTFFFRS